MSLFCQAHNRVGFGFDCEVEKLYTTAMLGKSAEHLPDVSYQHNVFNPAPIESTSVESLPAETPKDIEVGDQPPVGSRRWFLVHGATIATLIAIGYIVRNLRPSTTELWKNWQDYKEDQDFLDANRLGSSRSAQSIAGWVVSHVSPQESESILKNSRRITYTLPTQANIDFSQDRKLGEVDTGIRTAVRLVRGSPFLSVRYVIPSVMVQLPVKGDFEFEELVLQMRQDPLERQAQRRVSDIIKFEKMNEHGETIDTKMASLRMIQTYYDRPPMFELIIFEPN